MTAPREVDGIPEPYGVRPCRGHFYITVGGEDVINRFGDALDEAAARAGAATLNAEYFTSVEYLQSENKRLLAAHAEAEAERERLREALAFYADEANWTYGTPGPFRACAALAAPRATPEAGAERERLAVFARKVIEAHWDGGDVDSSDVDDWATAEGLLIPVQVTEPCGEGCRCEEYDNIPGTCYRFGAALAAPRATPEEEGHRE